MIEEGATVREIEATEGMPSWPTLRRWLRNNEEFRTQYAHAREASAEALELRMMDEAQTATDRDSAAAARVRVDTLKWIAAKRNPKVYGDKMQHDVAHSGTVKFVVEG
jgi:hypothetical protein